MDGLDLLYGYFELSRILRNIEDQFSENAKAEMINEIVSEMKKLHKEIEEYYGNRQETVQENEETVNV